MMMTTTLGNAAALAGAAAAREAALLSFAIAATSTHFTHNACTQCRRAGCRCAAAVGRAQGLQQAIQYSNGQTGGRMGKRAAAMEHAPLLALSEALAADRLEASLLLAQGAWPLSEVQAEGSFRAPLYVPNEGLRCCK